MSGISDQPVKRSKWPVSSLAGPYGHPVHAVVVGWPIGAWLSAAVLDVVSFSGYEPAALARAATWLIGIGLVGALVAAATGVLDFLIVPRGTHAWRIALAHIGLNSTAFVVFLVDFLVRWGGPDERAAPTAAFVLTLVGVVVLAGGGWLGGELVFRYGVRVAEEHDQAVGYRHVSERRRAAHGPFAPGWEGFPPKV
ncbi:hypothetical protein GCM10012275_17570 [Longimycelium tulufanense]|uniref:DUF2231 domain-containing protein n=2 Tax=Longimycelium tulufanense TaxID=907463 RepID=A0A8J3C777_9PSEU|nr:hypothetical protein GCM10012275_17570 [Longimycelium tulufanense]